MTSKTITLQLPSYYHQVHETDAAPLSVLRVALVVGQHLVEHRRRCDRRREPLRQAAELLHIKMNELLCILDVYEQRVALGPVLDDEDSDIDF